MSFNRHTYVISSIKFFRVFLLLLSTISSHLIKAQLDPLSSLYWKNYSMVNPANSGFDFKHFYNAQYRSQWQTFEGNPETAWIMADIYLKPMRSGLGLNYAYDRVGAFTNSKIQLNYSFQFKIKTNHNLSLGIAGFFAQQKIDFQRFVFPQHHMVDPALPVNEGPFDALGFNLGMLYRFKNLKVGLSAVNLNEPKFKDKGPYHDYQFILSKHVYFLASYVAKVHKNWELIPTIYLQNDLNDNLLNLNVRGYFKKKYFVGLAFYDTETFVIQGGLKIADRLSFAYSFDRTTKGPFGGNNSHEFAISFEILKE